MSQENINIVLRCVEAFDRGDYEAALQALDPGIEYDLSHFPDGRVYRGRDGVREAFRIWLGTWEDYRQERDELIDAGDDVIVPTRGSTVAVREAVWSSNARPSVFGHSMTGRRSEFVSIPRCPRPSKPWGCGSRTGRVPDR
jgi:ketosteroid isomerase-like protein